MQVQWNEKGQRLIPPMERYRFEQGESLRRLEGTLEANELGQVWYYEGEHKRYVGDVDGAAPAAAAAAETSAERDLDAPATMPAKSAKRARKPSSRKRK